MKRGPLIILSGPSGAGKSTVIKRLLERFAGRLRLSVSATTRPRRKGEQEGVDYYFWDRDRFEAEVARGGFRYRVVNDDLETAVAELSAILEPHFAEGE